MNQWSPCKRRKFVQKLKALGFDGPYSGSRYQFMSYKHHRMAIPSNSEYSISQLRFMLKEVEQILRKAISHEEWQRL